MAALSLGGWLLHVRIHVPFAHTMNGIPFFTGLISFLALPALFLSKKTIPYAYVINGIIVIIGTITMTHFSLMHPPKEITFITIFVGTLFADIAILSTKFFLGKALFELEMIKSLDATVRTGRFWRYPNMGWWSVHFVSLPFAYILGHLLWK